MKEATPTAGKLIPPTVNKKTVSNKQSPKQTASKEMEPSPANQDKSPPKKKKPPSEPSTPESADLFEATTAGASREISMLFSNFAQELSERAAADTSQMKELEGIMEEALNLESYLKEKKKRLRATLALISDKLQG